jgi:hypothetical protein
LFLALFCFGAPAVSAQAILGIGGNGNKPGSVLFYNIYTSSVGSPQSQNTLLSVTNTANEAVVLHWFFVDSGSCTVADTFTCLTGNQTFSFLASDYDPGTTGFAVAVAVNAQGNPRDFDFLIGSEYVKFASGHQASLPAESIAVATRPFAFTPVPNSGGTLVDLLFDDVQYERLASELALNHIPSVLDNNDTLVILNRIGGDLGGQVSDLGLLSGLLYNEVEKSFSFQLRPTGCQLRTSLSDTTLRTSPQFSRIIMAGTSGWMRLATAEKVDNTPLGGTADARAIQGAMINFNPHAQMPGQGFNQGHNLHRLTKAPFTRLRMPVIAPRGC